jgi:hypothetical protein
MLHTFRRFTDLGDLYQLISVDERGNILFTFFCVMLLSFVKGYIKEVKKNISHLNNIF